jgi:hypothetical protein
MKFDKVRAGHGGGVELGNPLYVSLVDPN